VAVAGHHQQPDHQVDADDATPDDPQDDQRRGQAAAGLPGRRRGRRGFGRLLRGYRDRRADDRRGQVVQQQVQLGVGLRLVGQAEPVVILRQAQPALVERGAQPLRDPLAVLVGGAQPVVPGRPLTVLLGVVRRHP
jgi:hypothetical protein